MRFDRRVNRGRTSTSCTPRIATATTATVTIQTAGRMTHTISVARKDGLDGVEGAKDQSADPQPDPQGHLGAQNLSGASRKKRASTIPSHTNVTAQAAASGTVRSVCRCT
jgi:hypothetical protein